MSSTTDVSLPVIDACRRVAFATGSDALALGLDLNGLVRWTAREDAEVDRGAVAVMSLLVQTSSSFVLHLLMLSLGKERLK